MTLSNKNKSKSNFNRPNGWGMVQNIMIASIRTGQIIPAALFLLLFFMVLKLNSSQTSRLFDSIGDTFKSLNVLGWVFFAVSVVYFERRMKRLRKNHSDEMDRVADEKRFLQETLAKTKLPKSKN